MSLAAAIAEATGLNPDKDFEVVSKGGVVFISRWDESKMPLPDQSTLDQWMSDYQTKLPDIRLGAFIRASLLDYLEALIYRDELQDGTKLAAIQAKIAEAVGKTEVDKLP
jgi:hypothetical protein